ncbi:MAG: hypothetical protein HYY16_06035 [Planctomycetes bacterium]|nr:hypothetical protein [Planctomycetota bacterium]
MIRSAAWIGLLALTACSRKEPTVPSQPTPPQSEPSSRAPKAFEGAAYLVLVEENRDDLSETFRVENQLSGDGILDGSTHLELRSDVAAGKNLRRWAIASIDGPADKAAIVVLVERRYGGRGRRGGLREFHVSGPSLTLKAPSPIRGPIVDGLRAHLGATLAGVRPWPGDITLTRDGESIVVTVGGRRTTLAAGGELRLDEQKVSSQVAHEMLDPGDGPGEVVRSGVRRVDLGTVTFSASLTLRHLGMRTVEVRP